MAVDRGSLDYTIRVRDQFSSPIQRFRAELAQVQRDLARARQAAAGRRGGQSQASQDREELQRARQLQAIQREEDRRARESARLRRQLSADEQQQARRLQAQLRQTQRVEEDRVRLLRAQRDEQRRNEQAARRAEQAQVRAARAQERANRQAEQAARRARREQQQLNQSLGRTEGVANRVAFTFRRLFGILAAFAVAREGVGAFNSLVAGGVQFNAQLDQSRLGLAGILSAVADIRNQQGELVSGAQAFAAAQTIARDQQRELQQDALATTATYRELLDVFQIALGPGLAQGLDVDQVRELAVRISQAASAIGLEQRQLSEEVRALLTGRIRPGQTRLADVLGVTNEDIRRLQALGGTEFGDALIEQFDAFGTAAEQAADQLTGLIPRVQDVIQRVSGAASEGFVDTLEEQLRGIFDVLTDEDVSGNLTPSPQAVEAFQTIFDLLGGIVERAGEFVQGLDFMEIAADAENFVAIAEGGFNALLGVVAGAALAIRDVVAVLAPLAGLAEELAPLIALFVRLRVTIFLIQGVAGRVVGLFAGLIGPTRQVVENLTLAERRTLAIERATRAVGIAFGAAFLAANPLVENIFGVEVSLGNSARIVGLSLVNAFQRVSTEVSVLSSRAREVFGIFNEDIRNQQGNFQTLANDVGRVGAAFNASILEFLGFDDAASGFRDSISNSLLAEDELARNAGRDRVNEEFELRERLRREQEEQNLRFARELGDILSESGRGSGFSEELAQRTEELRNALRALQDAPDDTGPTATPRDIPVTPQQRDEVDALQAQVALRQDDLRLREDILRIQSRELPAVAETAQIARLRVDSLRQQLLITRQRNRQELALAQTQLGAARGDQQRQLAQERINVLKAEQVTREDEILLKIAQQEELFRQQARIAEGSLLEGFGEGFTNALEQFNSAFQAAITIAQGLTQQFSTFLTDTIVQGFKQVGQERDIGAFFDNIRERTAQLLESVAQLILQQLIQLAIARAVLGVPPTGGSPATGLGFNEGGEVPGKNRGVVPIRPRNVDRRDTVNAWLQPKEFVHPVDSVMAYGADVMEKIRKRLIDPAALRALAGLGPSRVRTGDSRRRQSYQTGGLVTNAVNQVRAVERGDDPERGSSSPAEPVAAFIAASDANVEQFLNGGRAGFLAFVEENASDIDGLLPSRQT